MQRTTNTSKSTKRHKPPKDHFPRGFIYAALEDAEHVLFEGVAVITVLFVSKNVVHVMLCGGKFSERVGYVTDFIIPVSYSHTPRRIPF